MRIAVSNIAWEAREDKPVFEVLLSYGVQGIEIAPSRIWPGWEGANASAAVALRSMLQGEGFSVPALQAILFGRPGLCVFEGKESRDLLGAHIMRVADIAASLGAPVMVFGSPGARNKGVLTAEEADDSAAPFFRMLGDECEARGTRLCIEPNPSDYGCNWITTAKQGATFVSKVASKGFGLHLDAAGMLMSGDQPDAMVHELDGLFSHFHMSEPNLGAVPGYRVPHDKIGESLRSTGYDGWVSIEMRRQDNCIEVLERACASASLHYGDLKV